MNKVLLQGAILIVLFVGTWFLLKQVNWVSIFRVEENTERLEKKLGNLLWDFFKSEDEEILGNDASKGLKKIVDKICDGNKIERDYIKVHLLQREEVNAFALPDGHLVVYSGLVKDCGSPDELAGVVAHEIAHIELRHVMKKLVSEIGLSVLFSANGQGTDAIGNIASTLSSKAFGRELEKDADLEAVDYLARINVTSVPFAEFLLKLSSPESALEKNLEFLSTHPASEARAEYIINYGEGKVGNPKQIISEGVWNDMLDAIEFKN